MGIGVRRDFDRRYDYDEDHGMGAVYLFWIVAILLGLASWLFG